MSVSTEVRDGVLIILFADARILDEARIRGLGKELIEILGKSEEERVVLDFRNVEFMSSAMLGTLVSFNKKCKEFKVKLKLCSIVPEIREVFKITRLDKIFDIQSDVDSAVSLCCGGSVISVTGAGSAS